MRQIMLSVPTQSWHTYWRAWQCRCKRDGLSRAQRTQVQTQAWGQGWRWLWGAASVFCLLITAQQVAATVLGDLAAKMAPGTWAELETLGFSGEFLQTRDGGGGDNILSYAMSAGWDPTSQQFLFVGAPHYLKSKFIRYSAATNMWTAGPLPPLPCMSVDRGPAAGGCLDHAYDHNTTDAQRGHHYYRLFDTRYRRKVWRYTIPKDTWDEIPEVPKELPDPAQTAVLKYFPEMGSLILIGNGHVQAFTLATQQWRLLAKGLAMGGLHPTGLYNPKHKVVIFGGGNSGRNLYKLDATGTVTKLKDAPLPLQTNGSTCWAVDPVSGMHVMVDAKKRMYEYNVATDTWTLLPEAAPFQALWTAVAPIDTHGVTMWIRWGGDGNRSKVYLYKHAPGRGRPVPADLLPPEPAPAVSAATAAALASQTVLRVGPGRQLIAPSQAAAIARDGQVIEIDAAEYVGDVAVWRANNLTLRGVGGRAHLKAQGAYAEQKGIWVIKGKNTTVESIEFSGARVPDKNGAGIRQEGTGLTVRFCFFHDNEMGILTGKDPESDILIEHTEFARNGDGDGQSHNLYIGTIRKFTLQYSYSHHALVGHQVKSRALSNFILYNRLMDEADGKASYTIDLSNGGTSYIIGNLLQKSPYAENSVFLSHAPEGAKNPTQELYVVHNTFVNDRDGGIFVNVRGEPTTVRVLNNLFVGKGTLLMGSGDTQGNLMTDTPRFVDRARFDFRLMAGSPAIDAGITPGTAREMDLTPRWHYVHPTDKKARTMVGGRLDVGAYEGVVK